MKNLRNVSFNSVHHLCIITTKPSTEYIHFQDETKFDRSDHSNGATSRAKRIESPVAIKPSTASENGYVRGCNFQDRGANKESWSFA